MDALWSNWPLLAAMLVLIFCSAFFSASEAALSCLRWTDRKAMANGSQSQRLAERLLHDPDRLLSAVLFWNLVINIIYFALSSIVGLDLQNRLAPQSVVMGFAIASLLTIIFCSEMVPKSVAVLQPRALAGVIGYPLAAFVRTLDPIMPWLRWVTLMSRRLIWPNLKMEAPFELEDIGRAIDVSREDEHLVAHEKFVLDNIVKLSTISAREWMRPSKQLRGMLPPISRADVAAIGTPTGYILVSEGRDDEITSAVPLRTIHELGEHNLEWYAQDVSVVPWCASLADVAQSLQKQKTEVTVVVNELGETIGIVTLHDVFDALFSTVRERGVRLLDRDPVVRLAGDRWQVNGMTNLRLLQEKLNVELPPTHHATLGGVVQELLERLPQVGDSCHWGPLALDVIEIDENEGLLVQVHPVPDAGEDR